jgi:hypothetical protein
VVALKQKKKKTIIFQTKNKINKLRNEHKIAIKNNKANNNNKVKKPGKSGRTPTNGGKKWLQLSAEKNIQNFNKNKVSSKMSVLSVADENGPLKRKADRLTESNLNLKNK